ncbi:hypothetical protein QBC37DRAFT_429942 [Rhypophila decipiens]|uniref:Uncharacterized protein n=1 Tax=Rhypophila decipiens TaxID=261697 RepID=A0AAN6Y0E6_9PEZI|nr:hypothetical protein QBC37DRAFT_429942 [Rhypophila decipiens]
MRVKQLEHVLSAIALLKSSHDKPKKELISHFDNATTVDLSLRLMLMTSCSPTGSAGEDIFRPWWKDHETLAQYMQRIYPRYDASTAGNGSQPISLRKLSADYLKTYAGIRIQWTNHLTDHLLLLKGSNWKSVHIFAHPAFLLRSLQSLSSLSQATIGQGDVGTTSSSSNIYSDFLSRGCLPPPLLRETLQTFDILFPIVGDTRTRRFLEKEVALRKLDPFLLDFLQTESSADHETPSDVQRPTDIHGLYKQFPFWAARLQQLCSEAEDPEPTSSIGKYTERRKSPRFTYWCGLVAIMVAIAFGLVSTVLAALQVWISYCSWMDDSSVKGV